MNKLILIGDRCWKYTSMIAGFVLTCYMLLLIVNIVMRRFWGRPIFGIIEIVCYASLMSCCFALAQTEWKGGNVTMTLLLENISVKARLIMQIINAALCFAAFCYTAYQCTRQIFIKHATGGGTTDLHIPLYIITAFLALGFILLALCLLMKCILRIGEFLEHCKTPKERTLPITPD